jgi:hypothetical protein
VGKVQSFLLLHFYRVQPMAEKSDLQHDILTKFCQLVISHQGMALKSNRFCSDIQTKVLLSLGRRLCRATNSIPRCKRWHKWRVTAIWMPAHRLNTSGINSSPSTPGMKSNLISSWKVIYIWSAQCISKAKAPHCLPDSYISNLWSFPTLTLTTEIE